MNTNETAQAPAQVAIITPTDLTQAGTVLSQNQKFLNAYQKNYKNRIEMAKADGTKLKPETDKSINDYLVSAKIAYDTMQKNRMPYTKKADEFKKLFTTVENELVGFMDELKGIRNASATAYAKEEEEARRAEQLELQKKQERITLLAQAEQQVRNAYQAILRDEKEDLLRSFENATLATVEEVEADLVRLTPTLLFKQWEEITPTLQSRILSPEEIANIITNSKLGKFDKCSEHFTKEMRAYADHLLSMIPAQREALEKGEKSKESESLRKAQLEAEEQQRKDAAAKAESARLQQIKEQELALQVEQANRKAAAPNTSTIDSYIITVTGKDGWRAIVEFYLQNSGEEDLGKIKLDQMKAFAERIAKKTGECVEHSELQYEIKYKAVARAARKEKVNA